MTYMETIGAFLVAFFVALLGLQLMAAAYRRGVDDGRQQEASRDIAQLIKAANEGRPE